MYVNNLYILVHMYSTGVKIFGHSAPPPTDPHSFFLVSRRLEHTHTQPSRSPTCNSLMAFNLPLNKHSRIKKKKIFGHSHIWIFSEQVFIDSFVLCTSHINLRVLVLWGCILDVGYVCCGFCYVSLQNAGFFHFKH